MAACCIQYLWLLFVLGFTPFSGALKCHNGTMVKFGSGFTKEVVDWSPQGFTQAGPKEICQETFLIVDVGAKSVLVWSKGSGLPRQWSSDRVEEIAKGPGIQAAMYINFCEFDDCNNATSSEATLGHFHFESSYDTKSFQCPVCLTNQRSCPSNLVFCPKDTGCYSGTLKIKGGSKHREIGMMVQPWHGALPTVM
ncbi:CD177 antigen-like [Chionomys nivalis]|uniref:CD177 antigen-like n=1 Tax=Chionomys nivalis TaxID=269649 RepID=UPI00259283C3|nr:CD177 antigen-like [Chionomys nivalis]